MVLRESSNKKLTNGVESLRNGLKKLDTQLINRNTSKLLPAIAIYALGVAALYPFSAGYHVNMVISMVAGLVIILFGMRVGKIPLTWQGDVKQFILSILPAAIIAAITWNNLRLSNVAINPIPALLFITSAGIIAVMRQLIMARTEKGSDLIIDVEGLRLYMNAAEKSRLEMLYPPEETPELFERLLPYALALGVAKTWANRFADVLEATRYEPAWYAGPSPDIFRSGSGIDSFSSNLENQVASGISTYSSSTGSSPGSSSGSGGRGW